MRTCGQTVGRTDKQDEASVTFRNFAEAPKMQVICIQEKLFANEVVCDGVKRVFDSIEEGQREATHPD